MKLSELEQIIYQETPVITEKLYTCVNLFLKKNHKNNIILLKDSILSSQKGILKNVNA